MTTQNTRPEPLDKLTSCRAEDTHLAHGKLAGFASVGV
jgi:hypothetical protein